MRLVVLAVVAVLCLVVVVPSTVRAGEPAELRQVTVTGTAELRVVPDEVVLTVGVDTVNMDLDAAQVEHTQNAKKVFDAAKRHGIIDQHIQTDHVSLDRRYEYRHTESVLVGFGVRQTIGLTLRDIGKYEPLVTDLLKAGVNQIYDIEFRTTALREQKDEARRLAIKAAKEKATAIAAELGERVGRAHSIAEQPAEAQSSFGFWWRRNTDWLRSNSVVERPGGTGAGGAIAPGQIAITASVSVSFELE